jgi:hypothetical protein
MIAATLDEIAESIRWAPNLYDRGIAIEAFRTACRDNALNPVLEAADRDIVLMNNVKSTPGPGRLEDHGNG